MTTLDVHHLVRSIVQHPTLGYDQRIRRLAAAATELLEPPELGDAARVALDERVICDMYEGHAPFVPRYTLPDYARALRQGSEHLELDPPRTLDDALSFLRIMYAHVPSVTTYPVYLGDLDVLLEPFVPPWATDDELDATLRRFWIELDRMLPDGFVHANLGPRDGRVVRSILRVERSLRQIVPNLTLRVDPMLTPDELVEEAVRTVFDTAKPHFVNHPMMVDDLGPEYAAVSCYNSLAVGGGAHTLVRLDLLRAARRGAGGIEDFLDRTLPTYVELTCELAEARIRSLVEQQRFFDTHWMVREGLLRLDRFSAMFGVFGLAECITEVMLRDDPQLPAAVRWGHHPDAADVATRIVARIAELVTARPLPYCDGLGGRAMLHSQAGIERDHGVTAGTRVRVGDEPPLLDHLLTCAPLHRWFPSGISDIAHVDDTARRNPAALVDIVRGAFTAGMRDVTFNLDSNEFVRVTGYLVRKSDLAAIAEHGRSRHGSDLLAAGAEEHAHVSQRAASRVIVAERTPTGS
jgi:YjjI family glycine radical enzyme